MGEPLEGLEPFLISISETVSREIAKWCSENAFINEDTINGINFMKYNVDTYPGKNPAARITKDCQEHVLKKFNHTYNHVTVEETVDAGLHEQNQAFDFYIPKERTAIEVCCSVLENEIEKDLLKAAMDKRVVRLIIVGTNKKYKKTKYNAEKTWNQPGRKALRKYLEANKVMTNLFIFDSNGVKMI